MKFRWKVMLCTVCLMSVLFGVGSSLLISLSFSNALDRERSAAQDSYRALLGTLQLAEDMGALRNTRQLSDLLTQLTPREAAAWSGLELTSGEEVILRTGDAVDSMVGSAAAVQEDRNTISYFSDPRGRHYLQLSGCFSVDEQPYILTMAYEISSIYDARASQMRAYWFIFAGMLCVGAVMSYLVSVGLTRPLTRLSTATRAISNGDLSSRARLKTQDEIGAVGADFDAMAEKMEETVSQLRQSMERQEQFIGSFTHELKTPMTAIIGYADLLRQQTLTPEEQQDAANYIFSEARRLERLSIKLLQIQVGEHTLPELSPVSPASLLEDLAEHLRPGLAAEGISLCFLRAGRMPAGGRPGAEPAHQSDGQCPQSHAPWRQDEPERRTDSGGLYPDRVGHRLRDSGRGAGPPDRGVLPGGQGQVPGPGRRRAGVDAVRPNRGTAQWVPSF